MGATATDIRAWFIAGRDGTGWMTGTPKSHMIVACDSFDHDNYPVYVDFGIDPEIEVKRINAASMQRVMECYDLTMDIEEQMAERRAFHTTVRPKPTAPRLPAEAVKDDPLNGLNADERAVALAAVAAHRAEVEAERIAAEKRGTPTYQNTLVPESRIGVEQVIHIARLAGYTFFVWNGMVYPTVKATDHGIVSWDDAVCPAEDLT